MEISSKNQLTAFASELSAALHHILDYWATHTVDEQNGGFIGRISGDHLIDFTADKSAVLNASILWSFSAAFNNKAIPDLDMADRAYHYIVDHFIDVDFGGVFFTVDYKGEPKDTKKQVDALALTIYAFSEYFMACGDELVKERTLAMYHDLMNYCYDKKQGGYFEAFSRNWKDIPDLHLSAIDAHEKKTMNTQLHVLEAFTNLYRIWPDDELKVLLKELLNDFNFHIVDPYTKQLNLFFDENWHKKSDMASYGHNMEASWLLLEAAKVVEEPLLIAEMETLAQEMATASLPVLDPSNQHLVKEKLGWMHAEAMIGFFNAWQIIANTMFLGLSLETWNFVKVQIVKGEWWSVWDNPYHYSRACMELVKRIKLIL